MPWSVWPTARYWRPKPRKGVPNTSGTVDGRFRSGASRMANNTGMARYSRISTAMSGCTSAHLSSSKRRHSQKAAIPNVKPRPSRLSWGQVLYQATATMAALSTA